jgi:protein arginine kinase activator
MEGGADMKCELCGSNDATVSLKQVTSGKVTAVRVCTECAVKKGVEVQLPVPLLTDLLFGAGSAGQREARAAKEQHACPTCQMRWRDFRKTTLLGCPECYRSFSGELRAVLSSMHKMCTHVGKVPAREKVSGEILTLRNALAEAVAAQNFEEAARLRDAVKSMEARQRMATASAVKTNAEHLAAGPADAEPR